ncbi:hypothetical protein EVAR_50385_1, partial [Eumeta japonica]
GPGLSDSHLTGFFKAAHYYDNCTPPQINENTGNNYPPNSRPDTELPFALCAILCS